MCFKAPFPKGVPAEGGRGFVAGGTPALPEPSFCAKRRFVGWR
jgi:hypothetical protein